jgi:hypothetical protein
MRAQSDAESSRPSRARPAEPGVPPRTRDSRARLRWRAVIHAGQKFDPARGQQPVAWHLAECDDPAQWEAHCDIGRHLMATDGNPDGHCQVAGVCPRCPQPTGPSDLAR